MIQTRHLTARQVLRNVSYHAQPGQQHAEPGVKPRLGGRMVRWYAHHIEAALLSYNLPQGPDTVEREAFTVLEGHEHAQAWHAQ